MKSSDLLIHCLQQEGVRYIFGLPGEETLDILESIRNSKIQFVLCRHEQAAAFMAATYGRLTGKPGVVLSTLGPGATNLVTGVAYANHGGMPLVVVSGQKGIGSRRQAGFQSIDLLSLFTPVTKSVYQIESGDMVPLIVRKAFKTAAEERPGAVYIEFPEDIAKEQSAAKPLRITKVRRPAPDPLAIEKCVEMIQASRKPLLMIGGNSNRNRVSNALTGLVEKSGIYFFTTQLGKGVVSEESAQYLGCAVGLKEDSINSAIKDADLIISVGYDSHENPPLQFNSGKQKVVSINFYSNEVESAFPPEIEIVGDIANSISIISRAIQPNEEWDFKVFEEVRIKIQEEHNSRLKSEDINCDQLVSALKSALVGEYTLCLDNGLYKFGIARDFPANRPNSVLLDNALATMGAGLPSAITAKLLNPDSNVVAICGDGGFMMNSQELETALRLKLSLTLIILRDNAYGMIKEKQKKSGFGEFGLDFSNPDFVKYAESYGAKAIKIANVKELRDALHNTDSLPGIKIIEAPITY